MRNAFLVFLMLAGLGLTAFCLWQILPVLAWLFLAVLGSLTAYAVLSVLAEE